MSTELEFDEFFRADRVPLEAFLCAAGFDREDAQDAAAEAMMYAYRRWASVRSPRAWVRKVAIRIAVRNAQRVRESTARAMDLIHPQRYDLSGPMAEVDERLRLLDLLKVLPPRQREVIAWSLDGFSAAEIAEQTGLAPATVRSTLRHARRKLRATWERGGGMHDEP